MKPKPNQTHQTDLPSKHKSNPSPISTSPSTTNFPYQTHQTHCQSTHQTHRRSTHPPPSSLGYFSFSFMCHSSQLPFISVSRSTVMGERGVKLGKRVKWVYEGRVHQREPIFADVGLGCLPLLFVGVGPM